MSLNNGYIPVRALLAKNLDKALLVLTVLALFISILLYRPWHWDATAYHLPFSARALGISRYQNISPILNHRYEGFPIFWRFALAPGLALNTPRLYILPNILAAIAASYSASVAFSFPWYLGIACTLCYPISLIGFASSYQDYFVSTMAFSGALLMFKALYSMFYSRNCAYQKQLILGLVFLSLAANTKIQGLLIASCILFAYYLSFVFLCLRPSRADDGASFSMTSGKGYGGKQAALTRIASILISLSIFFQPISNIFEHQNPFYPFSTLGFRGSEPSYSTPLEYLPRIPLVSNMLSHFLSATELDPYILPGGDAQAPLLRSIDMAAKRNSHGGGQPAARTGGTLGPIYISLLVLSILSVRRLWSDPRMAISLSLHLAISLLSVQLLLSALPQSLELRYYMICLYIPSFLAVYLPRSADVKQAAKLILLLGLFIGILHLALQGRHLFFSATPFNLKQELPSSAECLRMGRLSLRADGSKTLFLDPQFVSNNIPFMCRMVMDKDIFIDYAS